MRPPIGRRQQAHEATKRWGAWQSRTVANKHHDGLAFLVDAGGDVRFTWRHLDGTDDDDGVGDVCDPDSGL